MILCWHIVINVLLPTDLIMLFPQEVKGYNVTNVGTSIRCFHRKSSLANFVIMSFITPIFPVERYPLYYKMFPL